MPDKNYRIENDIIGEIYVPKDAYYGGQTVRAFKNFQISSKRFQPVFIRSLGLIKLAAARANGLLGLLDNKKSGAITKAAEEIFSGKYYDQFILDIFQTGSGTSTNMNVNEVIANIACELLGGTKGDKTLIHPNDDVNKGQSSNDVIPTAIHIGAVHLTFDLLLPSLLELKEELDRKSNEFQDVIKAGRTHLQDATPITLGQEFGSYEAMIARTARNIEKTVEGLLELPLGGTAVGTGINTHRQFAGYAIKEINKISGYKFYEAENHFEAQGAKDAIVAFSGALRDLAVSLVKIANDIRLMASGPETGIGELILPELQPGSSIMPGKINPVIPEALIQAASQVIGNDMVIALAGMSGNFELNTMMPLIAYNILESIEILGNSSSAFALKCISGLKADKDKCSQNAGKSPALITPIAKKIGYDKASEIAREAHAKRKTIREILLEKRIMTEEEIEEVFDYSKMIKPD